MRELWQFYRMARIRRKQINRELDDERFADRQARHAAGIYQRPGAD
jgi:hypothetical protein